MKADQNEPAHARIERHLWSLLDDGAGVSEPMPTEADLARQFDVSVMTVRQAYAKLVTAGVVERRKFRGTWAVAHLADHLGRLSDHTFTNTWLELTSPVETRIVSYELREASRYVADRFGVAVGTPLTYLERLRTVDGRPVAWDTRWMAGHVFADVAAETFETLPVFDVFDRIGIVMERMESEILSRNADSLMARTLELTAGTALLVRQLTCTDPSGHTILVGTSVHPSSRFGFRVISAHKPDECLTEPNGPSLLD